MVVIWFAIRMTLIVFAKHWVLNQKIFLDEFNKVYKEFRLNLGQRANFSYFKQFYIMGGFVRWYWLEPGVNSINILRAALVLVDPKSVKIISIFLRRRLMKLSPGVNFPNCLQAAFACVDPESAKKTDKRDCLLSAKAACRTLIKLTPNIHSQI